MVTYDRYNIFYFSNNTDILSGVKKLNSIGTAGSLARTFIITDIEVEDSELKDNKYDK
ncbi:hypothetical protein [Xylocopilactobacillus apicola]|nr:hypothetical protein [Xylocopilactobacillus apicola]